MQDIAEAAANRATFQRGVEYYSQRRVSRVKIEPDTEHFGTKLTALVRGGKLDYEVQVSLSEKGELLESWCDCPAFYQYDGCCKHIVATMLCLHYLQKTETPPIVSADVHSETDHFASQMLGVYAKKQLSEVMSSTLAKRAKLVPQLDYDYRGNFSLSMTVGHDKMYIVKDLSRFYEDLRNGTTVEYGAKLTLVHSEGAFEETSRPLLRFFMNKFREFREFHTIYGASPARAVKRSLVLTPGGFDDFFELYSGQEVKLKTGITEPNILFSPQSPHVDIQIVQQSDKSYLVGLKNSSVIYFGEKYIYILEDNCLYRCDESFSAATRDFLYAISEKGGPLVVSEDDMGSFCIDVLSVAGEYTTVDAEGCNLSRFEPDAMTARLYLDMPAPMYVTARLRYRYGEQEIDALDDTEKPGIQRDQRQEYVALALVEKYIGGRSPEEKQLYIDDEEKIYDLLSVGLAEISSVVEVYTADSLSRVKIRRPPSLSVGVRLSGNLIDLDLDTGEFPVEELLSLLNSYKQNKRYHKLKDGSFINLEKSAFAAVAELIDGLDIKREEIISGKASVEKYRAMYLDHVIHDSELIQSQRDTSFKQMLREIKDVEDADIEPPSELKDVLRNYQKKGFRWLKTMSRYGFGGILADDMGLGKTIETIAFLQSLKDDEGRESPSIVVCPASLVLNWENEISRFAPRLSTLPVIGSAVQRAELAENIAQYDVIITSYELLKRDIGLYEDIQFDCEILDEAQFIKNFATQNAKAVKSLKSRYRFALTGTPVENSLAELWSVFDFLMPGYLFHHRKFREEYEVPITRENDAKTNERLRQLTAPFVMRRLKSNVLKELPPKTESVLYTNMEGEQQKLYLATLESVKNELRQQFKQAEPGRSKIIVLSMLTRLRQICCDPSLYFEDYSGESAKLKLCMELIASSTQAGHKVLLFSQFTSMLSIIGEKLKDAGISYYVLRGSTSKEERARLVNHFNADNTQVFLISLRAGGTGLNLTAADIVIHYDPWWNISVQNQATDRAHRMGQQNSVQVYKLIAKDTVEERILKLQAEKLRLAESVIAEGDGILSGMTQQQMMDLFDV